MSKFTDALDKAGNALKIKMDLSKDGKLDKADIDIAVAAVKQEADDKPWVVVSAAVAITAVFVFGVTKLFFC